MLEKAKEATQFLKSIANTDRLIILCQLITGEKNVTELVTATAMAQPTVSQQLSILRSEAIVAYRQVHRTRYYFIQDLTTIKIMDVLYDKFCKVMHA